MGLLATRANRHCGACHHWRELEAERRMWLHPSSFRCFSRHPKMQTCVITLQLKREMSPGRKLLTTRGTVSDTSASHRQKTQGYVLNISFEKHFDWKQHISLMTAPLTFNLTHSHFILFLNKKFHTSLRFLLQLQRRHSSWFKDMNSVLQNPALLESTFLVKIHGIKNALLRWKMLWTETFQQVPLFVLKVHLLWGCHTLVPLQNNRMMFNRSRQSVCRFEKNIQAMTSAHFVLFLCTSLE